MQDVIQLMKQSKSPLLIGIWGVVGIGKSTIAKAIYDQIGPYFEDKSFIDVSNIGGKPSNNAHAFIKNELLFDLGIIKTKKGISTIESLKIQHGHQSKRVLIILDNVDKMEQLDALCEHRELFGLGSKIIITTRDRYILKKHKVNHIYNVKGLDESESLELLNWSAFSQARTPPDDFGEISRQLVAYSRGWPLALKEIGFFLYGKEIHEWIGVWRSLQRFSIPVLRLLQALEDNFSALSDEEKQIFLDISCFFIGMNQNDVLQTKQYTTLQISLLEDKGLVSIDENNRLRVHVLLHAMARDIIERESSNMTNQVSNMILRISQIDVSLIYGLLNPKYMMAKGSKVNIYEIRLLTFGFIIFTRTFKVSKIVNSKVVT